MGERQAWRERIQCALRRCPRRSVSVRPAAWRSPVSSLKAGEWPSWTWDVRPAGHAWAVTTVASQLTTQYASHALGPFLTRERGFDEIERWRQDARAVVTE